MVDTGRGGADLLLASDDGLFGVGGGTFFTEGNGGVALFVFREGKGGSEEVELDVGVRFGNCGGTAFVFARVGNGGVRFGREGDVVVSEFIVLPMLFCIVFLNGSWASLFDCGTVGTATDTCFPSLGALGRPPGKGGGAARLLLSLPVSMPPRLFNFGIPLANKPPRTGGVATVFPPDPPDVLDERARPLFDELTDTFPSIIGEDRSFVIAFFNLFPF